MKKQVKLLGMLCLSAVLFWSCNQEKQQQEDADGSTVPAATASLSNVNDEVGNTTKTEDTANTVATGSYGSFEFTEELHDFGTIKQGDQVEHTFKFKNIGEAPLVISDIKASCGCTTPSWPKEPVAPNAEGEILVKFNSAGKAGQQNKNITITANVEGGTKVITIKTMVETDNTANMNGPLKKTE